jgi:hypothetical protein
MTEVKVFGYSERGIFNSIEFYLSENPDKIAGFLSVLDINNEFFKDNDVSYTFLNEQSFSDFGDNDWTIIAEKGGKKSVEKQVIFIEGKVKTWYGNYDIDKEFDKLANDTHYKGVSSNIFVQLYYKYLLSQLGGAPSIGSPVGSKKIKTIGKNKIVNKAYETYIKGASAFYYVAILPNNAINSLVFSQMFAQLNNDALKAKPMAIGNVKCAYWGDIETYFTGINGADDVIENFDYNRGQIY